MCILFLYIAKATQTAATPPNQPKLKLILASNRDEFYLRKTRAARFWDNDQNILAGQDCEEGGTWLGVSRKGKLAALLNIMSKAAEKKLKTRGNMVTGFLGSDPNVRGWTYCNSLHQTNDIRTNYGLFSLVTIDLLPSNSSVQASNESGSKTLEQQSLSSSCDITYFTNVQDNPPIRLGEGESKYFAFGNNAQDAPFSKVTHGCQEFEEIVQNYTNLVLTPTAKADLKDRLLTFLKSETRYYPDSVMENRAMVAGIPPPPAELTSIFVKLREKMYGTRTHSMILIDTDNNVNYHEWTMEEPIDPSNPNWADVQYNFKIDEEQ